MWNIWKDNTSLRSYEIKRRRGLFAWHTGTKGWSRCSTQIVFVVLSQACSVLRLYSCIWYSPCSAHLLFSWPVLLSACSLSQKHYWINRNQPEHHQQNRANCQRAIAEQTHHYTNKLRRRHCSFHRWTKLMHVWVGWGWEAWLTADKSSRRRPSHGIFE